MSLFCHNLICNGFHTVSLNQVIVDSWSAVFSWAGKEAVLKRCYGTTLHHLLMSTPVSLRWVAGFKKTEKRPYRICLLNPRRTLWLALQATYAPWPTKPLEDTCVCPKYCMVQHFHLLRGKSQLYLAWSRCTSENVRLCLHWRSSCSVLNWCPCFFVSLTGWLSRSFNIAHRLSDSNMTLKAQVKHSSKKMHDITSGYLLFSSFFRLIILL